MAISSAILKNVSLTSVVEASPPCAVLVLCGRRQRAVDDREGGAYQLGAKLLRMCMYVDGRVRLRALRGTLAIWNRLVQRLGQHRKKVVFHHDADVHQLLGRQVRLAE